HALAALENVALWHERDISHSSVERVILPDSTIVLDYLLHLTTFVIEGLDVDTARMTENLELSHGLVYSQRVLLKLTDAGLPRQVAYEIVQRHAMRAWKERRPFFELLERSGVPTHNLATLSDREMLCRRLDIIKIETVVRNVVAGSLAKRTGLEEGTAIKQPVVELYYKSDPLGDPMLNDEHVRMLR